jgi:hypothetical protein
VANNVCLHDGGGLHCRSSTPEITGVTFYGNRATEGSAIHLGNGAAPVFHRTIVAFQNDGSVVYCDPEGSPSSPTSLPDVFVRRGTGRLHRGPGGCGNNSADPLFCGADASNLTLRSDSPCLPGQHPDGYDCGLIGAFDEGCAGPTAVERTSWGGVKALFR